jgi:hypothetical protein
VLPTSLSSVGCQLVSILAPLCCLVNDVDDVDVRLDPSARRTSPNLPTDRHTGDRNFTPVPVPEIPGHAGLTSVVKTRFNAIYSNLTDNVKSYASEFFKTQLMPEDREIWRSNFAAGLIPHVVTALSALKVTVLSYARLIVDYATDPPGRSAGLQDNPSQVYLKVAGGAGFPELVHVGSATNLPKLKGALCGMPVQRALFCYYPRHRGSKARLDEALF